MARDIDVIERRGEANLRISGDLEKAARGAEFVARERQRPSVPSRNPNVRNPLDDSYNLWRRHSSAPAWIKLQDEAVVMAGGPNNAILSDNKFGNIIKGPLSIIAKPSSIRVAGLWVFNDLLTSMVPSSIITPMPTLIFSPPLEGAAKITEAVAELTSLLPR